MQTYQKLIEHTKKAKLLDSCMQLLHWDMETYMPSGAAQARAEQVELIASLIHAEKTHPTYAHLLESLIDLNSGEFLSKDLSVSAQKSLLLMRREYLKLKLLPAEYVKAFAKLTAQAQLVWAQARKENNFSLFAPYLEKIVEMNRQKAELYGYKKNPYDALLDDFEPDLTQKKLDPLFNQLGSELRGLLSAIQKKPAIDTSCLHGQFDADKQLALSRKILQQIGYNLDYGRLDLSTHPFSIALHPSDSRITSRIHPTSVFDCLSSVLHEAGHGLYEMGLPQEHFGDPICEAISLSIHESQSRFWETFIGQSRPFWQLCFPYLTEAFPSLKKTCDLDSFYQAINAVAPSYIRVESDEVSYGLHIILRYEIEKGLINKSLTVQEVPEAWAGLMEGFLGIKPANDQLGCLQDIHWSCGSFGYFPTYTLGNIYAAAFFDVFEQTHPNWPLRILDEGNLHFITSWLREMVHQWGHLYSSDELCQRITGQTLTIDPYIRYLQTKYKRLYDL
jgi:carboxypeptidase Taq